MARLNPGDRLGPYEISGRVGSGGMADVYRARDTRLGREVAVKVLPEGLVSDPGRLRRFEQEARTASALNHPNVVTIYDVGTDGSTHYIAMELVEGQTLRERLGTGSVPREHALEIATQLAEGLAKAHDVGIVHRDLKPENVMLTHDGRVKILDFGLSKLTLPEAEEEGATLEKLTKPGVVVGTLTYMSPEQIGGEPIDFRSDQFSLGAILHELLTGRTLFQRPTVTETAAAIREADPAPLPGSPLESLVLRCLQKNPERRFAETSELVRVLKAIRQREEPHASKKSVLLGLAAAVVVFVGVLVFFERRAEAPVAIRSIAVLPLDNLSGDPSEDYFSDGMTEALIASLAKVGELKVVSRTSVMRYKDSDRPLPEIAGELGVDAVVEGSALRVEDRVRITAQLIEARTDRHLWAETYDRDLEDVLALQNEVARAIASQIQVQLAPVEEARPVDPEAYEEYLKGHYLWFQASKDDVERSIAAFQRAIELDPEYAPAYQGLAAAYHLKASSNWGPDLEIYPLAKEAVLKALELDDTLAEAWGSLGYITYLFDWDFEEAERAFQRAMALDATSWASDMYASFLSDLARDDAAIELATRLLETDPQNLFRRRALGSYYYQARRYEECIATLENLLEIDPDFPFARYWLAACYMMSGRHEAAIRELEIEERQIPIGERIKLATAYLVAGEVEKAQPILDAIDASREERRHPKDLAILYTHQGEIDRAMEVLEGAFERREDSLTTLAVDPLLDPLREDPRFLDLLRRIGLPTG